MRTGLAQTTGLRQELRVNPRLYQAMDMLYMPMMDLQQHLKQELLANPFLELLEPEEDETVEEKPAVGDRVRVTLATKEESGEFAEPREYPLELGGGQAIAGIESARMRRPTR